MKDPKYRTAHGIEADKSLGEKDKKVLKGILTRQKLAEKPSKIDYNFLAQHYGKLNPPMYCMYLCVPNTCEIITKNKKNQ